MRAIGRSPRMVVAAAVAVSLLMAGAAWAQVTVDPLTATVKSVKRVMPSEVTATFKITNADPDNAVVTSAGACSAKIFSTVGWGSVAKGGGSITVTVTFDTSVAGTFANQQVNVLSNGVWAAVVTFTLVVTQPKLAVYNAAGNLIASGTNMTQEIYVEKNGTKVPLTVQNHDPSAPGTVKDSQLSYTVKVEYLVPTDGTDDTSGNYNRDINWGVAQWVVQPAAGSGLYYSAAYILDGKAPYVAKSPIEFATTLLPDRTYESKPAFNYWARVTFINNDYPEGSLDGEDLIKINVKILMKGGWANSKPSSNLKTDADGTNWYGGELGVLYCTQGENPVFGTGVEVDFWCFSLYDLKPTQPSEILVTNNQAWRGTHGGPPIQCHHDNIEFNMGHPVSNGNWVGVS